MIQTSYFAIADSKIPDNKRLVSIARVTPSWLKKVVYTAPELFPSANLLHTYKQGKMSEFEYRNTYLKETLSILSPRDIYQKYNRSVFLCYEKRGDFCHRNIVSWWLRSHGYDAEEFNPDRVSIAVVGSRGFKDYLYFEKVMLRLVQNYPNCFFVSGGAEGADTLLKIFCQKHGFPYVEHIPDWSKGKGAGFIRNTLIWEESDIGIAFWDGESRGTAHSIELSSKMKKKLYLVKYRERRIDILNVS